MKKLLGIVVLGLICCNYSFALTQDEVIKNYLSGKKLEPIEGIWRSDKGKIIVIYKKNKDYYSKIIYSASQTSGSVHINVSSGSSKFISGSGSCAVDRIYTSWGQEKTERLWYTCQFSATVLNNNVISETKTYKPDNSIGYPGGTDEYKFNRIWPENFVSHNAKFEKKDENKKAKKRKTKGASGTAFFITDKGHLITNNHVIEVCNKNSKIVVDGKDISANVIAKDALLDLALLKVDLKRTKFIHLSQDPPKKLQRIIAAGYPLGKSLSDDLKFTSGIISSLKGLNDDSTLIQIDAALNKGNSGGPIIDEESGELVAVAVAGLDKSETEAVNFGIKTNSVRNFLDANQLEVPVPSFFSFGVDAADILEKATVYTYCKN
tara:strand:- start:126 stop:1259 length:1134 start_codon:yes stop_codon:yes gene_type:complete